MDNLWVIYWSGWWLTNPSEKYEFVNWDDDIPNMWENNKCSKPPTSIAIAAIVFECLCDIWAMETPGSFCHGDFLLDQAPWIFHSNVSCLKSPDDKLMGQTIRAWWVQPTWKNICLWKSGPDEMKFPTEWNKNMFLTTNQWYEQLLTLGGFLGLLEVSEVMEVMGEPEKKSSICGDVQ